MVDQVDGVQAELAGFPELGPVTAQIYVKFVNNNSKQWDSNSVCYYVHVSCLGGRSPIAYKAIVVHLSFQATFLHSR